MVTTSAAEGGTASVESATAFQVVSDSTIEQVGTDAGEVGPPLVETLSAMWEQLTVPAWTTVPVDLAGFGRLPVGAVRCTDERLDSMYTFGKSIQSEGSRVPAGS